MRPPEGGVDVDGGRMAHAPTRLIEDAVRKTLASQGRPEVAVSVALLDDRDMRELNRRYLGTDASTDVLAFALGEGEDTVGDVYIGIDQARRQAADVGVPLGEELVRLAIHGTLHVLGYDHPEGSEREESPMFSLQERLLRELLGEVTDG